MYVCMYVCDQREKEREGESDGICSSILIEKDKKRKLNLEICFECIILGFADIFIAFLSLS